MFKFLKMNTEKILVPMINCLVSFAESSKFQKTQSVHIVEFVTLSAEKVSWNMCQEMLEYDW